jgi:protein TonB
MPRTFTLVSVSIHAVVIAGVYVAQAFDSGPLPIPREALAFSEQVTPIKLADIPLPRPAPQAAPASPTVSPNAAPLDAPDQVRPETGRETEAAGTRSIGPVTGVEQGVDGYAAIGVMPGVTTPPPPPDAPPQPIHLHSGIVPPRKIVGAKPVYPALAQAARQEGTVILETIIDARGNVENVHVLRGYPLLDQAAIDAVRGWRFTPALLNGQPIPVVMTVTVTFSLK